MKITAAINYLGENWDDKADEYAALVNDGSLSADEAAQRLIDADLEARKIIREEGFNPGPGHNLNVARQAIDSRLPGYKGLIVGRHI